MFIPNLFNLYTLARFFELTPYEVAGELTCIDWRLAKCFVMIGEGRNVVFVSVCQQDCLDVLELIFKVRNIRDYQINSKL